MTPRTRLPTLLGAATLAAVLVCEGRSFAADPMPAAAHLGVQRPGGAGDCPDAAALAATVARIRGRDSLDTAPASAAAVKLDVVFERDASGYRGAIRAGGARSGERAIADRAGTCSGLTDAVAAALALIVDDLDVPAAPPPPTPRPTTASFVPDPDDVPAFAHEASRVPPADAPANNSVFFELLGAGLLYSVNYERFLLDGQLGLRAGATFVPAFDAPGGIYQRPWISFPAIASYYIGPGRHKLQLGVGTTIYASLPWGDGRPSVLGNLVFGYRYVPKGGGLELGGGFTPVFGPTGTPSPLGFMAMGGFLIGARF